MADEPKVFAFGGFEVDEALQELRRDGHPVEIHATPLRLLLYLLRNRARVIPKEELLDQVWPKAVVSEDALFSALKEIRHALSETGSKERTVETLRGRGYRVTVPVEERPAATTPPGQPSSPDETIRSIAVLPLENLSNDLEQEYFADGMTDAVISEFARLGAMRVISRTSAMQYKRVHRPLPEIAQELNVQGVVEGSVFRAGNRVRITLQLIDARNDLHVWAQTYDRDLSDVLALQSDVARAVAAQIRLVLSPEEEAALEASRSVDPRAYDAYLRGLQLRGPVDLAGAWAPAAVRQLEQAVELDPNFAEAWAQLAEARMLLGSLAFDRRVRGELPKARAAARRALEIDDRSGRAYTILGLVRLWYDWDFDGARRAHERAMELSPSDPGTLASYAWYLLRAEGRTEEALDLSERLLRVAPLDLFWRSEGLGHFFLARQYERVLHEAEQIRELDPNFIDIDEAEAYFLLDRFEEAYRASIVFYERCGTPCDWMKEAMERGWAESGFEGAQRAWLEAATEREWYSPVEIARVFTRIGETEEAFNWLERGYRERDPWMIDLKVSPSFDPLRSDPRFDDLLRRIGFPEG